MASHRVSPTDFNNFTVITALVKALYPPVNTRRTQVLVSRQKATKGVSGFEAAVVWYDLGDMVEGGNVPGSIEKESRKESKGDGKAKPTPTLHPVHGPFRGKTRIAALQQLLEAVEIEAQSRMPEIVKEVPSSAAKDTSAKNSPDNTKTVAPKEGKGEAKATGKAKARAKTNVLKRAQDDDIEDDMESGQPALKKHNRARREAKTQNSAVDKVEPESEVQGKKGHQSKIEKEQAKSDKPQPTTKGKGKGKIKKAPAE
ncbi:hypothetical protein BKA63DRAFT_581583 [Paraphoma chrysanthemicola]|nr:hypothetical protein BKA63DRAFT_581583 [Paraphoma chrysanthemicola]